MLLQVVFNRGVTEMLHINYNERHTNIRDNAKTVMTVTQYKWTTLSNEKHYVDPANKCIANGLGGTTLN